MAGAAHAAPIECTRLKDVPVAGMHITSATLEPAGPFSVPAGGPGPAQTLDYRFRSTRCSRHPRILRQSSSYMAFPPAP